MLANSPLVTWMGILFDFIVHLDVHLAAIVGEYGLWTYLILFLIIFCETGLVVTPFLPGDSLLFAAGALSAVSTLDPVLLCVVMIGAAISGDALNYTIGRAVGPAIFERKKMRFIKHEHLLKTQAFYNRHGGKTIVIARFMPIIRTFAPFVAGIATMHRGLFLVYNVLGALLWVLLFTLAGFYFGNVPAVKENFTIVLFAIIAISISPAIFHAVREMRHRV